MSDFGVGIIGTGHYLPVNEETNEDLCQYLEDMTPEMIVAKTGIKRRFHISEGETASSMSVNAANNAIKNAGIEAGSIGLIVVASFSQDYLIPSMSAKIHAALGVSKECQIMDINTACAGMVTALTIGAERMKADSSISNALLIGVEVLSKFTNKSDKDTAIFFSDGASAVVLGKTEVQKGFKGAKFLTDSSTYESVRMRGGGSSFPVNVPITEEKALFFEQQGLATWKQAVTNFPIVIQNVLKFTDHTIQDIDFIIFHQANGFLIDYLMKKMKVPLEKTYTNVGEIGNTGAASIGIALDEAFKKGLIKEGNKLLIAGIGAGFNFGACIIQI
jgi:3-oxoacyl-[acyl-carrier-protein] synthase-3